MVVFGLLLRFVLPFVKSMLETLLAHFGLSDREGNFWADFLQMRSSKKISKFMSLILSSRNAPFETALNTTDRGSGMDPTPRSRISLILEES